MRELPRARAKARERTRLRKKPKKPKLVDSPKLGKVKKKRPRLKRLARARLAKMI
ncbi:hypothetical protein ES703_123403 [subsurface metagenome]